MHSCLTFIIIGIGWRILWTCDLNFIPNPEISILSQAVLYSTWMIYFLADSCTNRLDKSCTNLLAFPALLPSSCIVQTPHNLCWQSPVSWFLKGGPFNAIPVNNNRFANLTSMNDKTVPLDTASRFAHLFDPQSMRTHIHSCSTVVLLYPETLVTYQRFTRGKKG